MTTSAGSANEATTERDERGRPVRILGLTRDVTERRRREEADRFLAEASATPATFPLTEEAVAALARLAVPDHGDWCSIELLATADHPGYRRLRRRPATGRARQRFALAASRGRRGIRSPPRKLARTGAWGAAIGGARADRARRRSSERSCSWWRSPVAGTVSMTGPPCRRARPPGRSRDRERPPPRGGAGARKQAERARGSGRASPRAHRLARADADAVGRRATDRRACAHGVRSTRRGVQLVTDDGEVARAGCSVRLPDAAGGRARTPSGRRPVRPYEPIARGELLWLDCQAAVEARYPAIARCAAASRPSG